MTSGSTWIVLPEGNIKAAGKCETSFTGNFDPLLLRSDSNGKMIELGKWGHEHLANFYPKK